MFCQVNILIFQGHLVSIFFFISVSFGPRKIFFKILYPTYSTIIHNFNYLWDSKFSNLTRVIWSISDGLCTYLLCNVCYTRLFIDDHSLPMPHIKNLDSRSVFKKGLMKEVSNCFVTYETENYFAHHLIRPRV